MMNMCVCVNQFYAVFEDTISGGVKKFLAIVLR